MITIFTPTYNRARTIPRLFESLQKLDNKNFEWLVIDDGSIDNTEELIYQYIEKETSFPIRYLKTSNGGKPRAINLGATLAKGDIFFIVDSDDWLPADSLDTIWYYYTQIKDDPSFAGVAGARLLEGKISGGHLKSEYIDATNLERLKFKILGERAEVFKTDILKKYPFPNFEGENFIPEAASWNAMGRDGLKLRWFDKSIYSMEYQDTGITMNLEDHYKKNPKNYLYYISLEIKNPIHPWWRKCIYKGKCISLIRHSTISKKKILKNLQISNFGYYFTLIIYQIHHFIRAKQ